ncbi:MAG: SurA N-terminal domain-containing protein [Pseudomonadales bacterium]|jgi:peptidyl-prolyl cis-trans isomerase D|nr:SurA N-terminal domain-containing protein [Pseudomonadales bacterium]|tara:strand:- start:5020 stop:6903 length:1884 start_codon:yes stop_codon:yes gene_type:complete
MLQDIRDNSQGVISKVIIGVIIAVFALTGASYLIDRLPITSVAEVNGEEITEAQLQAETQQFLNSIGAGIDSIDQELLEQIALNQLIEQVILRQSTEDASMAISSNEIDRQILQTEAFQIDGVFNSDLAVRTMAAQFLNVPQYRAFLRQQLLLVQMANAYSSSNFVTKAELNKVAELTGQTRDFRYISITLGARTLGTAISNNEIAAYYEANTDNFIEEESVLLDYVVLSKNQIAGEIQVDEAQLRAQYESEREAYEGSSEKRAAHILFEVGADRGEDDALALAGAARQRIVDGEDFGALALEFSSDVVSAEEGGDIGYTDGSAFPLEIEEVLESLTLNELSGPVVTEFGVHLVKLTEDSENLFQPYEEVAERIERDLKSAEVELIYGERLGNLSNLAFETGDLLTISEELNLVILQSEPIGRSGGSAIFANQALITAAFSDAVLLEGNNSDVIELDTEQAVVLRVREFTEAVVQPLQEVQPEIAVILRTEMEKDEVQELGNRLLAAAVAGEGLDELLVENELGWIVEEAVERIAFTANREIINKAFEMQRPTSEAVLATITLDNGTFVLLELNQVQPGAIDSLEEDELITLTDTLASSLGNSDFEAFLNNLKGNADIQLRDVIEDF